MRHPSKIKPLSIFLPERCVFAYKVETGPLFNYSLSKTDFIMSNTLFCFKCLTRVLYDTMTSRLR